MYMYVCMYKMYGVVLYTDDVQLLHEIFLIYDQCIYSPEIRYTNIFSLNTDEVRQRIVCEFMYSTYFQHHV